MIAWTPETVLSLLSVAILALAGAGLLVWISFVRPRLGLYLILALAPTQFVFVPVLDFFTSLADALILCGAAAFTWRLARGHVQARRALQLHVFVGVMIAAYLVGFIVLGHFSRTLVRIPMAVTAAVLACELLTERRHLARAIAALIAAAVLDIVYGIYLIASGQPGYPGRFSGMMGVNFSAMVIMSGAAMAFAKFGTYPAAALLLPAALTLAGLATLSKMGVIVLAAAWLLVVWQVTSPRNRRLIVGSIALLTFVAASQSAVRDRVLARVLRPEIQLDGIERTSTDVRILILRSAWGALAEAPFVGVGYYNFEPYSRNDPEIRASTSGVGYGTHNTYLEILVEGGLLAFVPFLLHFLNYARSFGLAWDAIVRRRDPLVAAAVAGFIVVMISASVANVLLHYLFWSTCGVTLACLQILRREVAIG
jgi:O-antigen ligase